MRVHAVHTSWADASSTIRFDHVLGFLGSSLAPSTLAPDPDVDIEGRTNKVQDSGEVVGPENASEGMQNLEKEAARGLEVDTSC